MDKNEKIAKQRDAWLQILKQIVEKVYARETRYNSLCPQVRNMDKGERTKVLREIAAYSRQIEDLVHKIDPISWEGGLGVWALLDNPDALTSTVVLLLVASRLDSSVGTNMRSIADLMHFTADRDPVAMLRVRSMFRSVGALYPHVNISRGMALDDCSAILKESALNKVLGLSSDVTEARCDAEALIGRVRL